MTNVQQYVAIRNIPSTQLIAHNEQQLLPTFLFLANLRRKVAGALHTYRQKVAPLSRTEFLHIMHLKRIASDLEMAMDSRRSVSSEGNRAFKVAGIMSIVN